MIQKSTSLKYEPASEPLHVSVKQLFSKSFVAGQRVPEVPFPRKALFEVPEFDVGIAIEHHSSLRRVGRMPPCQTSDSIVRAAQATLEATQGQIDVCFSQLPYKCHQNQVAFVGD